MHSLPDRVPVGDILILRGGLQNIVEDATKLLAKRKQARMLMRLLDELLEHRESARADPCSLIPDPCDRREP